MNEAKKGLELRREERDARFSGEYSCRLIANDDDSKQIAIRPHDVSRRGLGFFVREALPTGSYYWLLLGNRRFRVELAYCNLHLGIERLYRAGLFLREADGDLRTTCQAAGLLADEHRQVPKS
jgi:hypothetical protein